MSFLDKLIQNRHEKQKDNRIEKAKQLMAEECYDEANAILSEGLNKDKAYKFDMWSDYRYDEVEKLYRECCGKRALQKHTERRNRQKQRQNAGTEDRPTRSFMDEIRAASGDLEAQYRCGRFYYESYQKNGEKEDRQKAYDWLKKAAIQGHELALELIMKKEFMVENNTIDSEPQKEQQLSADRFGRTRTPLQIGTIGHIEKEKPTLGIVIANVLRHFEGTEERYSLKPENSILFEKQYGIPMASICVNYKTNAYHIRHMDCFSDTERAKIMIAENLDGIIWIVDARERITAGAAEQLRFSHMAGVQNVVVFVDHCDLFEQDEEALEQLDDEIQTALEENGYWADDVPIVHGCASMALENPESKWGHRILELTDTLDEYLFAAVSMKNRPFLMPVEDVFRVTGRGTVVTGRVENGIIKVNDRIEIVGFGETNRSAVVTGIESFRKLMDFAEPGDNIGLLLRGVDRTEVQRGHVITKPGIHKSSSWFMALIYFSGNKSVLSQTGETQMYFGIRTIKVLGTFSVVNRYRDGKCAEVKVKLEHPLAMEPGLFFSVQDTNENAAGFGKIMEA